MLGKLLRALLQALKGSGGKAQTFDQSRLRASLTLGEGKRLKPYRCPAGKLTIGIGRNLDDVGISNEEAEMLLDADIARSVADLDAKLPWWRTLDDVRQRVLIEMCFNMGIGSSHSGRGLLSFVNTLECIRRGEYEEASRRMLESKWADQVGQRADRLSRMMRAGED